MTLVTRRDLLAAGAAIMFATPAGAASAPLRVVDHLIFVDAVINGRAVAALLDSAAELTVLDRAFAASLGLGRGTTATAIGTGVATARARLVGGVTIAVAGLALRPARVAVINLADVSRRLALPRIDVIAGRNLFDAARLSIDLEAAVLHVVPPGAKPPGVRLPLTLQRGIEALPLAIEGRRALADFDLGNSGTVLVGAAYAQRHGLLDGRALTTIPGGGIGGMTRQTSFRLRSLDLAGRRFDDVPAAIDASATAADANIGVRLLRGFGIVTDFTARAVWLDPRG